jgi:hypothetical protein
MARSECVKSTMVFLYNANGGLFEPLDQVYHQISAVSIGPLRSCFVTG